MGARLAMAQGHVAQVPAQGRHATARFRPLGVDGIFPAGGMAGFVKPEAALLQFLHEDRGERLRGVP